MKIEVYCTECAGKNVATQMGIMVAQLLNAGIDSKLIKEVVAGLIDAIDDEESK